MADLTKAIQFVLEQEDSRLSGIITETPHDLGGTTRFGLTERWHPALIPTGFFGPTMNNGVDVPTMSVDDALALARKTYASDYGEALLLADLNADAHAAGLLSFAVVGGNLTAIKVFQQAIADVTPSLGADFVDGHMGPGTIKSANAVDAELLLQAFVNRQKEHFQSICDNDPTQDCFLHGWTNRADALLTYQVPAPDGAAANGSVVA
ncbi:MAG TPA: putative peptidoglycan-binding domain-containing protein [Acidobacteriaceae bacterium]